MVGKRQRNQPRSRQPTRDAAGQDSVRQGFRRGCRGQHKWLVAVGLFQCFEPASSMECRGARMASNQVVPARVGQWIDDVQRVCESFRRNLERLPRRSESLRRNTQENATCASTVPNSSCRRKDRFTSTSVLRILPSRRGSRRSPVRPLRRAHALPRCDIPECAAFRSKALQSAHRRDRACVLRKPR